MDDIKRKVHSKTRKVDDIEVHVSTLTAPNGVAFVDIREFIISLGHYGRGITIPADIMGEVIKGVQEAVKTPPRKKAAATK